MLFGLLIRRRHMEFGCNQLGSLGFWEKASSFNIPLLLVNTTFFFVVVSVEVAAEECKGSPVDAKLSGFIIDDT